MPVVMMVVMVVVMVVMMVMVEEVEMKVVAEKVGPVHIIVIIGFWYFILIDVECALLCSCDSNCDCR